MRRIDLSDFRTAVDALETQRPLNPDLTFQATELVDALQSAGPEERERAAQAVKDFVAISEEHAHAVQLYLATCAAGAHTRAAGDE